MGVTFVTSANLAIVWFITRMNMTMFLPVGTVSESSVTALELTFERLFT